MSIEASVLSDRSLSSTEEWQRAIDAEGFPLRLDATVVLSEADGFFPAYLGGKLTGFECHHDDAAEMIANYPEFDFGKPWKHAIGFRVGGNFTELYAAYMAAAAYARATDGVVWDGESGEVMSPDRAAEVTRDIERDLPRFLALGGGPE